MELAIVVNGMTPFVQATYRLEGDGFLAVTAYGEIMTLESTISTQHYPNANAVARLESIGIFSRQQYRSLEDYIALSKEMLTLFYTFWGIFQKEQWVTLSHSTVVLCI